MNPEEGELRPQLLDRFGLCVDITGLRDVDERVRIVERDARRSVDGAGLDLEFEGSEEHLRSVIVEARRLLPRTEITPDDQLVHRARMHRRRGTRPSRRHRRQQRFAHRPRLGGGG